MIRLACAWIVCFGLIVPAIAQDEKPADKKPADTAAPKADNTKNKAGETKPLTARLKAQPDDRKLFDEYMNANLGKARTLLATDPDKAEKHLDKMQKFIESLKPTTDPGKQIVGRAKAVIGMYRQQVTIARISLKEAAAKLKENPDDSAALSTYRSKLLSEVGPLTRTEPGKAEEMLKAAKELLAAVKEQAKEDATKKAVDRVVDSFARYESSIEAGKKLKELIGSDAIPLNLDSWVNGEPLTDEDLKGKVVMLDFWAVWCGPCVSTFPHLREWHEQYADKGLVIIGLTRHYGYTWDEEAGRPKRASGAEKPTPEQENEMLQKFAEANNLHHRIAIQKDSTLSEHYGVTGIPHVVVIDRQGKVRLIRVGSGEANANAISEMLAKLIAE